MTRYALRLLGLLVLYSLFIEPARLRVTRHDVRLAGQPLTRPVRALLLTDWHLGRFSLPNLLRAKIKRLLGHHRRQPFDLLLLGGDFLDDDPCCLHKLSSLLALLPLFGIPVYAVLGNHDYTSFPGDAAPLVACLETHGITVLRNEAVAVEVGKQRLLIVGLDDLQEAAAYFQGTHYKTPARYREAASGLDWYAQFDECEPSTPRILLAHNPDAVYLPGRTPLAVLAGHTHGGQVIFLDWLSRTLHPWIHRHLPPGSAVTWAGRRKVNGRTLIVSRGMEGSSLPLRLLRPPEALAITFR